MTVDRYTKVVLTVIAICLVWISLGGSSLMTPVSAQVGEYVILSGWVDERGSFKKFPAPLTNRIEVGRERPGVLRPELPVVAAPLPIWQSNNP